MGGFFSLRFVDDLAGAVYDIIKFILRSISYLLAGTVIVAVPMYLIFGYLDYFSDHIH